MYLLPETKEPSEEYLDAMLDSALYYYEQENYVETRNMGLKLKQVSEKYFGQEDYIVSLEVIMKANHAMGKYPEAIRACEEALEIIKRISGKNSLDYVLCLSELSTYKSDNGEYKEAISIGKEALRLKEEISNDKDSDYIYLQEQLAACEKSAKVDTFMVIGAEMFNKGERIKARTQFEQAKKVCEKEYGKESVNYAQVLVYLSLTYTDIGDDLPHGVKLMEEAKQ